MTTTALGVSETLALCDRALGELGRRRHLFTWLRAPGAGAEEWLPVDAYYPGHRLVVVWRDRPSEHDTVYAQRVPAHGLRLLELSPAALGGDPEAALRRMIGDLAPATPPEPRGDRPARTPAERHVDYGIALGLALGVALFIELYLGVARGAVDHGHIVLAFGLALDACARTLGTLAARRAAMSDWAWGCALIGSPLIVIFWRSEPAAEPAPLAGLLAIVAMLAFAVAVVTG